MSHNTHEASFSYQPLELNDFARRIGLAIAVLSIQGDPERARASALHILLAATGEDGSALQAALN